MKIKYLFLTMAAVLIAGCSDELDRGGAYNPEKGVTAIIPTYPFDGGTRVNISDDLQIFTWSDGDELGIYTRDNELTADARFKILQGGSSTGNFSNDMFYLNSNRSYYSFYPYQPYGEIDSVPVDYTGQTQNRNGSAAHLGAYNYMYGTVNINSNGGASIAYKNLGSVMQLRLTVSNAANYTGIDITSDGAEFIMKGKANMANGSITATETSASIHLDFESGISLNGGDVLTANILVAPVDMSGSTLTITLTDADNNEFVETTAGKNMLQGKAYLYETTFIPYVTFTADEEQTFQMSKSVSTLEYSVNGSDWTELGTTLVTFGSSLGKLRLRGKNLSGTAGNTSQYSTIQFGNGSEVNCTGDIRTLIDYENYSTVSTSNARFCKLFYGCRSLIQAPELPATDLAGNCYYSMFNGCTSLTQAPELPATNLAKGCYNEMFRGCTSLTQIPSILPATNLVYYCYQSMFSGCTSLTQAPELPATTLATDCYRSMFSGCTSLTQAPELPATDLAENCYYSMFNGCTSLTQAPELPATNLAEWCYTAMFSGCTSLTQAPELPASDLNYWCYGLMFYGCTNLNYIKMMATDIRAEGCLNGWVDGISSTGTFVKNKDATWDVTGDSGIPSGWTVETASE